MFVVWTSTGSVRSQQKLDPGRDLDTEGGRQRERHRDTETHRQSDRRRDRTGDHFEGPCEKRAAVVMAIVAPVVVVVVLVAVQLQPEGCVTLNLPQTVVFVLFAYDHLRDHVGAP